MNQGYCHHGRTSFATWHRPYLVLLEVRSHIITLDQLIHTSLPQQEIQNVALELANEYPEAERFLWQFAAQTLRQPYWGWDRAATIVPPDEVIALTHLDITTPNLQIENVPNPFFSYRFGPGQTDSFAPFGPLAGWPETARNPDANGVTDIAELRA